MLKLEFKALLLLRCCFFHRCCLKQIGSMGCRADRKLHAHVSCESRNQPRCQGVTVCDRLQCVCDKTTAECMAAAHFNHSLPSQRCLGPVPPCRRASRPPRPVVEPPQSSEESKQSRQSEEQAASSSAHHPDSDQSSDVTNGDESDRPVGTWEAKTLPPLLPTLGGIQTQDQQPAEQEEEKEEEGYEQEEEEEYEQEEEEEEEY